MDSGNSDYIISSADAEALANSAQALGVSNSSYSTSQSDTWSTYKCAEFLAQDEHGMTYQGGLQGGWTHPTTGNPLTAAQYMQISADLRAQQTAYKGKTDIGHANSQYTAQLAANGIRNTQAMIASINRQPCNSGSSYNNYSNNNYNTQTNLTPGQSWTSGNTSYKVNQYGSVDQTKTCWKCGAKFDSSRLGTHC